MADQLPSFEELMQAPAEAGDSGLPSFESLMDIEEEPTEAQKFVEPAWTPYLISKAKDGLATLTAMPGIPVSLLNEAQYWLYEGLEAVGGPEAPERKDHPLGYGSLQQGMREALSTDIMARPTQDINLETQDPVKRYIGTVAEFAGGSMAPGMYLYGQQASLGAKITTAITESTSVALAGLGAEASGDTMASIAGEEWRATGEIIGTVAGGFTPYALPRAVSSITGRMRAYMEPAVQEQVGRMAASNKIKEELANIDEAMDALADSQRLRENIPGYSPSMGMATDDVGIKTLEQRFAESSPQSLQRQLANLQKSAV